MASDKRSRFNLSLLMIIALSTFALSTACFEPSREERARERFARGQAFEERGSLQRAGEEYRAATRLDRTFAEAHIGQSSVFLTAGNYLNALASVNKAFQINENLVEAHNLR